MRVEEDVDMAADVYTVMARLQEMLGKRFATWRPRRMVGLLFVRPEVELAKSEILGSLEYLHGRSGDHVDFFCLGYSRQSQAAAFEHYAFSVKDFLAACAELEGRLRWNYGGGAELLLIDIKEGSAPDVELDFDSAVAFNLVSMVRDEAIESVAALFEEIILLSKQNDTSAPELVRHPWQEGRHFRILENLR